MKLQSLLYTIIEPKGGRYNNDVKIGDKDFTLNTKIDEKDFTFTNRVGVVKVLPPYEVPFEEGDELLVHHNVFRSFWQQSGRLATSSNLIEDNQFFVSPEEVYAYRKEGQEWTMIPGYLLVNPMRTKEGALIPHHGIIHAGENKGDKILMNVNCEYEFYVDDMMLYRVRSKDIAAKLV